MRDLGSVPGLVRSHGEGNSYLLQYSDLENSMDCIVHGVTKSLTQLSNFRFHRMLVSFLGPGFCGLVPESCLTLCDPMDYSPPGSSVHEISQERTLEWAVIFSSGGSSWPRNRTHLSCVSCITCIGRWTLYHWATREAQGTKWVKGMSPERI